MRSVAMSTCPYWFDAPQSAAFRPLDEDLEVDVLVVGGGITGVTAAYLLSREKRSVALLERDRLGGGNTGHTTAHLTFMTDTRLSTLVRSFNGRQARLAWEAGRAAMNFIRNTVRLHEIDCDWTTVPGYLEATAEDGSREEIRRLQEEAMLAKRYGFEASFLESGPVNARAAVRFPDQMMFHPLRYLSALAERAVENGARIFENCAVKTFHDAPARAVTAGGNTVRYRHAILATHVPLQGNSNALGAAMFQTKLALYTTYALAAKAPAGAMKEMIWSDTGDPFLYLRAQRCDDGLRVILGGEDHKTGQADRTGECFRRLEDKLRRILPQATPTHHWSGQVVEPPDGLPYIGDVGRGQFIATGFSGNGITFGTAAAMMARDWVLGIANPCDGIFRPGRKPLSALKTYLKENCDFPSHLATDRLLRAGAYLSDLPANCGRIVMCGGEKTAAYRDEDGSLHLFYPVCPHLGCIVAWNDAEKSWDCPCHGSRFDALGRVIAGPAESDLERIGKPIASSTRSQSHSP